MDGRERRVAENEALFRELNERVAGVESRWSRPGERGSMQVVCECADPACGEQIAVTNADYERVRADGSWFLVVPGHEDRAFEQVVDKRRSFYVVEKTGQSKAYAEHLDPRSRADPA